MIAVCTSDSCRAVSLNSAVIVAVGHSFLVSRFSSEMPSRDEETVTGCDDDRVEREFPDLGGGDLSQTPDPGDSILVTEPTAEFKLTARHESDVHTAIIRGLAGYLA